MKEVIRLEEVYLWRRTQEEFSYDLKQTIISLIEKKYRKTTKRLVLENINLVVKEGEKVGIIGANGSGKSTLLKVITGILKPSNGIAKVKGQISPLIELGAGFDPNLSVKDNIILYGVMIGFSRQEMKERLRYIMEFAELEDYYLQPVKGLSSGMIARLGFAIATDVKPDILILDEILSVGDEQFRHKCQKRLERLWNAKASILVASHDLDFIQNSCEKAIYIKKGKIQFAGSPKETIHEYLKSINNS
jgi:ABC-type polysaccharide/polyol phosphate transport system ATPase subunit